eukprot:TRINITY_DN1085_c0_g1_i1.p1 TRINITY_DN1085_c0_g1~~TRINITY_DN1085_c0_g1_i1.p1  ORF type:complete len:931 (+),score=139.04 TRINITY_DN1085_c0_g1_i1:1174-3966(+)
MRVEWLAPAILGGGFLLRAVAGTQAFLVGMLGAVLALLVYQRKQWQEEVQKRKAAKKQHNSRLMQQGDGQRRTIEQLQLALEEKLLLLNRMSQKMQQPSNEVLQKVQLLLGTEQSATQVKYATDIRECAMALLDTSNDLIKILAADSGIAEVDANFNVQELVEEILEVSAERLTTPDVELVYAIQPSTPAVVFGNGNALRQVLMQLMNNALAHTTHGEISINIQPVHPPSDDPSHTGLEITVRDTGVGISPEMQSSILSVDGHRERKSKTGLGLILCNKLVRKLLGGVIHIKSRQDEGTQVIITCSLRLPTDNSKKKLAEEDSGGEEQLQNMRVLVVDDNVGVRNHLCSALSSWGCITTSAADGVVALRDLNIAISNEEPFHVILLDNYMPQGGGEQIVATIRGDPQFEALQIVLLVCPIDRDKFSTLPNGVQKCLTKPVKTSALLDALSTVVNHVPDKAKNSIKPKKKRGSSPFVFPLNILLADDDPLSRQTIEGLLESVGHSCTVVDPKDSGLSLGECLIDECKRNKYDAVFMDIDLEPYGGVGTGRMIRMGEIPSLHRIPIVLLSGHASENERQASADAGIDKYMSKPVRKMVLNTILEELVAERETQYRVMAQTPASSRSLQPASSVSAKLEHLERVLSVFVPREFQELISPGGVERVELGDAVCKSITILFSDIRDFTSLTERMYVNQVMEFINNYLAFALPPMFTEGGFVDKFIGDAIMAIFAHGNQQDQAVRAVRAAVNTMHQLDFRNETCEWQHVETGIGINTGKTIMGVVGTETRMEPTVLGDAVNLASRTESLCKKYGARILITQNTREAMQAGEEEFMMRLVDHVTVKGKSAPVRLYEVINGDRVDVRESKERILETWGEGMELFLAAQFEAALNKFQQCLAQREDDKPALLYVNRCQELVASDCVITNWDGVFHLAEK